MSKFYTRSICPLAWYAGVVWASCCPLEPLQAPSKKFWYSKEEEEKVKKRKEKEEEENEPSLIQTLAPPLLYAN